MPFFSLLIGLVVYAFTPALQCWSVAGSHSSFVPNCVGRFIPNCISTGVKSCLGTRAEICWYISSVSGFNKPTYTNVRKLLLPFSWRTCSLNSCWSGAVGANGLFNNFIRGYCARGGWRNQLASCFMSVVWWSIVSRWRDGGWACFKRHVSDVGWIRKVLSVPFWYGDNVSRELVECVYVWSSVARGCPAWAS
jgi:hypothetical protein